MKYNTIKIQKGNDCELQLRPRLLDCNGKPGKVIPAEELTDVQVRITNKGEETSPEYRIQDGRVCVVLNDSLKCGEYDVCLSAKWAGRDIRDNRQEMFAIVEYGDGINYALYKQDFVIIGSTPAEIDELRARMLNKIEEAENAKDAADNAKADYLRKAAELDGVAQEATAQAIKADMALEATAQAVKATAEAIAEDGAKSAELEPLAKEATAQAIKEELETLAGEAAKSAELAPMALEATSQAIKSIVERVEQSVAEINPEGEEKPKLYDMVASLASEMALLRSSVTTISATVTAIETKVDSALAKIDTVDDKVETATARIATVSGKVFTTDGKVDVLTEKVNTIDQKVDELGNGHVALTEKVDGLVTSQASQDSMLFDINNTVNEIDGHLHPNQE